MSKTSGKDTKPEILVRKYLFSKGFRFRKNVKDLPGKLDIVLQKYIRGGGDKKPKGTNRVWSRPSTVIFIYFLFQ